MHCGMNKLAKLLMMMEAPKQYVIIQGGFALSITLLFVLGMLPTFNVSYTPKSLDAWIYGLTNSSHIVLVSHIILRPFIHLFVLQRQLTALVAIGGFTLIVLAAALNIALTNGHMTLHLWSFELLQHGFTANLSQLGGLQTLLLIILSPISFYVMLFSVWCICYCLAYLYHEKATIIDKMKTLQSTLLLNQLNPHFLFNAFNSIRALIHEDKDKADEMLLCLTEMFRDQLQMERQATIVLRDDWLVAKRYLDIEQVRFEERLSVDLQIEESCWNNSLPTFTLLCLVENAVKHGIASSPELGQITVSAKAINDKRWQLQVNNSVYGEQKAHGTGTGLKNLKARLRLLYGHLAFLTSQKKAQQFSVILELDHD